ncbi:MAG TPA: DUF177 domain-containing protein [Acidobacteriota bacterium]|nr:DUF177 domain-containing protein [Acidobacteriota bacterium]
MFIVIEDLKPEPLHVRHVFPAKEIMFSHADAFLKIPVTTDFVLTRKGRDLHFSGNIETEIGFTCSRCAKEFSQPFAADFDLFYRPHPTEVVENSEIELKYEDMEIAYYDGVVFDVNVMVLEQIELAMPMKFVCSEDCRGLCCKCGADLNEEKCLCMEKPDPRMSALLDFKHKMKQVVH